ncbi:MAG: hypothetical protein IT340_19495 [Chloroflexi bacterium]|nr:hypothetical protein [Chloroflexota bacterium]
MVERVLVQPALRHTVIRDKAEAAAERQTPGLPAWRFYTELAADARRNIDRDRLDGEDLLAS